jgi:hypothetical protein
MPKTGHQVEILCRFSPLGALPARVARRSFVVLVTSFKKDLRCVPCSHFSLSNRTNWTVG